MKTKLMFLLACTLLLLCCCESFFESNKEKLDKLVAVHWEKWKAEGKDTTMCIVDFAEMIPLEWDTMVYVWYFRSNDEKGLYEYMNDKYWVENEKCRGNHEEKIHFWKNGRLVYVIDLNMASDKEKGVIFCTDNSFIKRERNDAKFHVNKNDKFYIIRDMTEKYQPEWRYVNELNNWNNDSVFIFKNTQ